MKEIKFNLKSMAPILFHNVYSMDLIKPAKMKHGEFEASEEMFKSRLYLEGDKLILPTRMIYGLLKNASAGSGIRREGKRSTYTSIIKAVVFILDPIFLDKNIRDVQKHKEYVRIGTSKVLRIFPILKEWSGILKINYDDSQISDEVLEEIIRFGGNFVGFGDYRPTYGRFNVERI